MPRGMQPELTEHTRQSIIEAFLALAEANPTAKISVSMVAEKARCSRSTFYRHFKDMNELIDITIWEYTCFEPCDNIISNVLEIPLEEATDEIAEFYENRKEHVRILCTCDLRERYLNAQAHVMAPMFSHLISRAIDISSMQLEYVSQYVADAKAEMIRMWVDKGQVITLGQINKMIESIVETSIWTKVALYSPKYGKAKPKLNAKRPRYDYPWAHLPIPQPKGDAAE